MEKRGARKRERRPKNALCAGRKGQYRDKVGTDHVSDTERTYRKGKRKMSRNRAARWIARAEKNRRTRARARVTCVENLERYRERERERAARGRATLQGEDTPGDKYNKGSDGAYDAEWTKRRRKRRTGRKNGDDGNKKGAKILPRARSRDGKKKGEKKSLGAVHEGKNCVR